MNQLNTVQADSLWQTIRSEIETSVNSEPILASFLHLTVLRHKSFAHMLAFHLSSKMSSAVMGARALYEIYLEALHQDPSIISAALV